MIQGEKVAGLAPRALVTSDLKPWMALTQLNNGPEAGRLRLVAASLNRRVPKSGNPATLGQRFASDSAF